MKFDALTLTYDARDWSLAPKEGGFVASCLSDACRGRVVVGTALPRSSCRAEELLPVEQRGARDVRAERVSAGGLQWVVARWWRGCRNAHPQSLAACAERGGTSFRIEAPVLTCRIGPQYGADEAIFSLIGGLAP